MWGAIGKAINDTIFKGGSKPLNRIIEVQMHNSFYNTISANVSAYGDGNGSIVIVPYGTEEITGYADNTTVKTAVIPITVKTIGRNGFSGCTALESIVIPYGVTALLINSFQNCNALTSIHLPNTIKEFSTNTFTGCDNLSNIYVDWKEDAIAGAPWGAPNATVHYNSEVTE